MGLDTDTPDDERFEIYLGAVLSNMRRQVSAAYTLCGCELASRVTNEYQRKKAGSHLLVDSDCTPVPMDDIYRMSRAVGADNRFWELRVWEECGKLPGFDEVLRDTNWEQLDIVVADTWLSLFTGIEWEAQTTEKIEIRLRAYLAIFPEWHRGLMTLTGVWQEKYVRMLHSFVRGWENADSLRRSAPYLLPLQLRLCRAPYSATADGDCVLSPMAVHLPVEAWQQLAACDDRTWLIIERACRRDNDAVLISRGLHSLALCWPTFLMQAFASAPKRLMRTAQLLGCLSYDRRRQFLSETAHTIWFATKWTGLDPYEACRTLYRQCVESGLQSPVPRRLRDHFEGRAELTVQQFERHCRVSLARLPTLLLAALEQQIWSTIDAPFNLRARSTAASHAVRMLAGADGKNRRGLRRFLLAYRDGRPDAHLDHPLNRAWFARHPRIDAGKWRAIAPSLVPDGTGDIHLALETDPLEILMLGTYVGSCLGLGGLCDYSAIACLLDANKQVIYARDASGRVLARQLLAIDESDRLVCFAVYPVTASPSLVAAFHTFAAGVAQALGIDMYINRDDATYDIAIVLAVEWWDDGVWQARASSTQGV